MVTIPAIIEELKQREVALSRAAVEREIEHTGLRLFKRGSGPRPRVALKEADAAKLIASLGWNAAE